MIISSVTAITIIKLFECQCHEEAYQPTGVQMASECDCYRERWSFLEDDLVTWLFMVHDLSRALTASDKCLRQFVEGDGGNCPYIKTLIDTFKLCWCVVMLRCLSKIMFKNKTPSLRQSDHQNFSSV